ncbi:UNVERIFIED_CONTAM: LRR receptor-like serine/threonine-protein kinase GHR1 [Sesamum radiatum]|uniref:LRR receptor-like serine/threonine-protein kinase GHR1 n=1 Tax=Sesamum radiatum TaxID=300843 RepID=A0AAW2T063_SESRA
MPDAAAVAVVSTFTTWQAGRQASLPIKKKDPKQSSKLHLMIRLHVHHDKLQSRFPPAMLFGGWAYLVKSPVFLLSFVVKLIGLLCLLPDALPSQDILALLEFKKGIKHDPTGFVLESWNDESIDFNGCPSSWNGIMCNGGNVAAVVLDNLGLSADADLSVFSNLTMLVKLSIANNSISGKLPDNLGEFKSLEYLDISDNLFFSSLPSEIGKLVSLKNLSLAGNNFSGSIPDAISGLASIRSLDMSRNSFLGRYRRL